MREHPVDRSRREHRRREGAGARLFVAVYPPPEIVAALAAEAARLQLPEHRPVPPEQVHITVHFVGAVAPAEIEPAAETLRRAVAGLAPFELRARRLVGLPPRAPRLVAAETDLPPELHELHRRLVARLAQPLRRGRKSGGYLPHLTLCRFTGAAKAGAAVPELPADLAPDSPAAAPFPVPAVRLMRSVLHPKGPEHRLVAEVALG